MITKRVTYTDYDGVERTEDFRFNLSKPELLEMNFDIEGGIEQRFKRIVDSRDMKGLYDMISDLILRGYGEKSPDGKRFNKTPELREAFKQSEAFSVIIMEMFENEDAFVELITGMIPQDMRQQITQQIAANA